MDYYWVLSRKNIFKQRTHVWHNTFKFLCERLHLYLHGKNTHMKETSWMRVELQCHYKGLELGKHWFEHLIIDLSILIYQLHFDCILIWAFIYFVHNQNYIRFLLPSYPSLSRIGQTWNYMSIKLNQTFIHVQIKYLK